MVTISTEEYADLIRAQHTLELIITMSDEWISSFYKPTFNAIVGIEEKKPITKPQEFELADITNDISAVKMDDKQIEEVWGKPHETV